MKKLKCWEKDLDKRFDFSYYQIYTGRSVILKHKKDGKYDLVIEGTEKPKSFHNKAKAFNFAQKYMKEYDSC